MEQAVSGLSLYKKSGGIIPLYVIERLENATAKHQEVISNLVVSANEAEKSGLQGSLNLVKELISSVGSFKQ